MKFEMKWKHGLTLTVLTLMAIASRAQLDPIQIDRPDQTECPYIVPVNYLQAENGFLMEEGSDGTTSYTLPSVLWKYGMNEKFELRFITELAHIKEPDWEGTGLSPVTIGFKSSLCEQRGVIPKTSFIGHVTTATAGTKAFTTRHIAPSFRFTMQHILSDRFSFSYNLGAEWDGETPSAVYIYTATIGASLTDRLGCYAEAYGFIPDDRDADHRVDGGFTYLVSNDVILDISGGAGLTENSISHYLAIGFSYRIRMKGETRS